MDENWKDERNKIIGLGENSLRKSYYPELQRKIEELEASQNNLASIINSTNEGILIHDNQGHIVFMNKPAERLLNVSNEDKAHLTIKDISSDKNDLVLLFNILETVRLTEPKTIEWIIVQKDTNAEIQVQISINNTLWNGQRHFIAVIRDFTERKEYEEKLLKAKEKAEENDRLKSAFLQNMSHEIRTPMNAIVGFTDFLTDPDVSDEERKEFIRIIKNSTNQLLSIVSNILTISILETKQEHVNIQPVNLNKLLHDLYLIFTAQAQLRNLSIDLKVYLPDNESEIYTDKTKLNQIISNLLNNAMKFTPSGTIEFGYTCANNDLIFYVKDSGLGISKDIQTRIFDRFFQSSTLTQSFNGGMGLGLAISKEFVDLLGGRIWVESEVNEGSTFYFSIQHQPVGNVVEKKNVISIKPGINPTILVAEDEEYNYLYLLTLLKSFNANVIHSLNGEEAVNACKSSVKLDLILMDIKMPVMDGYTAARIIKAVRPDLPIIAQSAYLKDNEKNESLNLNFDDYVTKPIDKNELSRKIQKFLKLN
jgi:PAS domain S-box-containing protein